jgi:hypothetical protein
LSRPAGVIPSVPPGDKLPFFGPPFKAYPESPFAGILAREV